ncbi:MAG: tetratricopeptide repeat protein [Patescibacteria group bacterium]
MNFNIQKSLLDGWKPYICIIVLGFLIYSQVLFFGLTYLDDSIIIINNQNFFQNPQNIIQIFKQPDFISPQFYRPILHLFFFFESYLSGTAPFLFHLTTFLLHLLGAILVFLLFLNLEYKKDISLIFSLIFVAHPVLTQSVAWIPGRTDSLWSIFAILSFIFLIKFIKTRSIITKNSKNNIENYKVAENDAENALSFLAPKSKFLTLLSPILFFGAHLFFLILTLLSKETAIVLPIIFIFYILFIQNHGKKIRTSISFLLSWSVIIALWLALRKIILSSFVGVSFYEIKQSIIAHIPAIFSYIGKILFPFNLSVLPHINDLSQSIILGFVGLILIVIALVFSKNKRFNFIVFGVVWFIVALLPSFIISKIVHESRIYFPIIGFFIIFLEIDWIKKIDFSKIKHLIIFTIIILFFSVVSFLYVRTYATPISFWQNAIKTSPHSSLARLNLGVIYFFSGNLMKSEIEYKKAIELNPKEQMAHNNLGFLYQTQKRYKDAEIEYKKEIKINPNYDVVYYNLGLLYYENKNTETAKKFIQHAIFLNPKNIYASELLETLKNIF